MRTPCTLPLDPPLIYFLNTNKLTRTVCVCLVPEVKRGWFEKRGSAESMPQGAGVRGGGGGAVKTLKFGFLAMSQ